MGGGPLYPASFEYNRPDSVEATLELLEPADPETSILAGGQSLIPALNLRLARPKRVVDINRLGELDYVRAGDGLLRVGALTRHKTLLASPLVGESCPILSEAARYIGHPQIRTLGTLGGSLAHADPAAELPCLALATGAQVRARSAKGEREIPADELFVDLLTTALRKDELLVEVCFPTFGERTAWGFAELSRRPGDFGLVAVAAVLELDASGTCRSARVSLAGAGPRSTRSPPSEASLLGSRVGESAIREAARAAAADADPPDDLLASASYRRQMVQVLVRRALQQAMERLHASAQ